MKKKFPWLTRRKKTDPEIPYDTPIWLGSRSNGEYFHFQTEYERKLRKLILEKADENARRLGMDRREFMTSAMGMATTLLCIDFATGCSSSSHGGKSSALTHRDAGDVDSGRLCIPKAAMFDENAACTALDGNQFIFDVQTHWFSQEDTKRFPQSVLAAFGALFAVASEDNYTNQMFVNSDTSMAVLTSWPGTICSDDPANTDPCGLPLSNDHMADSRDKINQLACGTQRVVQHFQVLPNDALGIDKQLEMMTETYCSRNASGWKMYPGFASSSIDSAKGTAGYFLDEDKPRRIIEHGLSLGLNRFCVHKGLPIGSFFEKEHNYPKEIGKVASDYQDAKFIIYHSGICSGYDSTNAAPPEGPYDANEPNPTGTNALIRSLLDTKIEPNSNVYAEVGSAINQVQTNLDAAAHFFGKLMKYVGLDRVVWGTDCVIYGSPQPFIEWFRALTIPQEIQDKYGYPALDDAAKAKIFGLNAATLYGIDVSAKRCKLNTCQTALMKQELDEEYGRRRWMFQRPGGPRTYREYVNESRRNFLRGRPG